MNIGVIKGKSWISNPLLIPKDMSGLSLEPEIEVSRSILWSDFRYLLRKRRIHDPKFVFLGFSPIGQNLLARVQLWTVISKRTLNCRNFFLIHLSANIENKITIIFQTLLLKTTNPSTKQVFWICHLIQVLVAPHPPRTSSQAISSDWKPPSCSFIKVPWDWIKICWMISSYAFRNPILNWWKSKVCIVGDLIDLDFYSFNMSSRQIF